MSSAGSACSAAFDCFADNGMTASPAIATELDLAVDLTSSPPGFEEGISSATAAFGAADKVLAAAFHCPSAVITEYNLFTASASAAVVAAAVAVYRSPAESSYCLPVTTSNQCLPLLHSVNTTLHISRVFAAPSTQNSQQTSWREHCPRRFQYSQQVREAWRRSSPELVATASLQADRGNASAWRQPHERKRCKH
jgi:hypothetical protein